jgi:hypothetical protein
VNCHQEEDWNVVLVVFRHQINVPTPAALAQEQIPIVISKKMVGVLINISISSLIQTLPKFS